MLGVPIDYLNCSGETALHAACANNRVSVARELIALGSNVNANNNILQTPLHIAVEHNYVELAKLLLDNNAGKFIQHQIDSNCFSAGCSRISGTYSYSSKSWQPRMRKATGGAWSLDISKG